MIVFPTFSTLYITKTSSNFKMDKNISEKACVYAALIMADDNVEITAEKIKAILAAANVDVDPYWPGLFAQAINGIDVKSIVGNVGVGSSAPSGGVAAPSGENNEEAAKEEVKEESEEESDDDMGFGLFD